jgi:hypothetical protein
LALVVAVSLVATGAAPATSSAAVCADYSTQAAAQAAGDTRDADGDGIYCESLPCPCSTAPPVRGAPALPAPAPPALPTPGPSAPPVDEAPVTPPAGSAPPPSLSPDPAPADRAGCSRPAGVQNITFSSTKYPNIRRHFLRALRKGWPRTLILNRAGADERRARLLVGFPARRGYDRDEYPPAVGRGIGTGLTKGLDPRGWRADVAYVPSAENRSHGSTMGIKLRRFCSGTRFRYVFY